MFKINNRFFYGKDNEEGNTCVRLLWQKLTEVERKWYVVDAEGQTLGRLASEVASILRGKTNLHLHHTLTRVIM